MVLCRGEQKEGCTRKWGSQQDDYHQPAEGKLDSYHQKIQDENWSAGKMQVLLPEQALDLKHARSRDL